MTPDFASMVSSLETTGDYRVMHRLKHHHEFGVGDATTWRRPAIILDVETTGLSYETDEIIELGMLKVEIDALGRIIRVLDTFNQIREPSKPIPQEITAITGITNDDVAGKTIDLSEVAEFIADAKWIVAHNAGFDRKFAEAFSPAFESKLWACSLTQLEWSGGSKLGYLLAAIGLFHDAHRASDDCWALLEILRRADATGKPLWALLIENARLTTHRFHAVDAPYTVKDVLKARKYKWGDGSNGGIKSWWKDVPSDAVDEEYAFLDAQIYRQPCAALIPRPRLISAMERFSSRV
jgi:DNA polymerase-3 subunit epsilon